MSKTKLQLDDSPDDIYTAEEAESEIISICEKFQFNYHATIPGVYITTPSLAHWFIDLTGDFPRLYHGNYRGRYRQAKEDLNNFHYHANCEGFSVKDMLLYIQAHDHNTLHRLPKPKQKQKYA